MDVSDIFYFFGLGESERGVRGAGRGGGSVFLMKMSGGGGVLHDGRGREGVCGELGGFGGGGGLNIFFRGRNVHQGNSREVNIQ